MAYRAIVATSSTEYSPYVLKFGRQFPFPIDFDLGTVDSQKPTTQTDYIKKLLPKLEVVRQIAQMSKCIRNNTNTHMIKIRNQLHTRQAHLFGYTPQSAKGYIKKTFCKVTGPYYITLTMNHDAYRIRDVKTNKEYGSPVHLSRLRPYHNRELCNTKFANTT